VGAGFRSYPGTAIGALRLALLAALGVILEIFVVEKKLLTRGEDEIRSAINTLQNLIREFHGRLPRRRELAEIGHDLGCAGPVSLSSYVVQHKGPGRVQNQRRNSAPGLGKVRDEMAPSPDGAKLCSIPNRRAGRFSNEFGGKDTVRCESVMVL
jgi:hypothetical protein